jgi:anti-anti-sigma factor
MSMPISAIAFEGHIIHDGSTAVVVCSGEIDLAVGATFRALLDQALEASNIVVDMSDVSFLDSTGLRILAIANAHSVGQIVVTNPTPAVARVLALSGMDRFIAVQSSPEQKDQHVA